MIVSICLDDNNGVMFNKRRQSRDREVIREVILSTKGMLYIHPYSKLLFSEYENSYACNEEFLDIAGVETHCFVENKPLIPYLNKINEIHIYRWNRHYPSDMKFEVDLSEKGFQKIEEYEFKGSSHEKISKEVWVWQQDETTSSEEETIKTKKQVPSQNMES